jgi:hypothetical protein
MRKFFLLFSILLTGCVPQPTLAPTAPSVEDARQILIHFFELLNAGEYAKADLIYGGDYAQLEVFNAEADPDDHAALWSWACESAGLQCLKIRAADMIEAQGETVFFQVEFSNADGSLFVLGPCCGANETEMPPVSQFVYRVTRNSENRFVVMDLPPYTP